MMRKRLLCVVLTLAMLFSAQSAAAAAQTGDNWSMIITADTRLPIIDVTVPGSAWVYINPYRLPVAIEDTESYDQIVCDPSYILSESDVPLSVDVRVTTTVYPDSDMLLVSSSTKGLSGGSKRAFIYFEMQSADPNDPDAVEWDKAYDANKHILLTTSATGQTKKDLLTLQPLTMYGEVPDGGSAAFRLTGDAVVSPQNPWTAQDGLSVSIVFTFTPIPYV